MNYTGKKVLIITYYWPPSGGAGVQRWLKFVKYLRQFGWDPIVYTPKNNEIPVYDASLEKDIPDDITVLKKNIREPYAIYKRFIGAKKGEKFNVGGFISESKNYGLKDKISTFIRGNFFIPDARKFWIRPSVRFLSRYFKNNAPDLLITTGPPHSMHLIGLQLRKKLQIPWIADFRDPWTRFYQYRDMLISKWADKQHKSLEKKVLQTADRVITVGWTIKGELENLGADKPLVITNGYDEQDFDHVPAFNNPHFSIVHTGNISRSKNTLIFWKAIAELVQENESFSHDLEIRLAGKLDYTVHHAISDLHLESFVKKLGYQDHNEAIKEQKNATILLLMTSNTPYSQGAIPGRLFEYLAAHRPILAIANPNSDMAKIIHETQAGEVINYDQKHHLKSAIIRFYNQYKKGPVHITSGGREKFSRKHLTAQLVDILNELTRHGDFQSNT